MQDIGRQPSRSAVGRKGETYRRPHGLLGERDRRGRDDLGELHFVTESVRDAPRGPRDAEAAVPVWVLVGEVEGDMKHSGGGVGRAAPVL